MSNVIYAFTLTKPIFLGHLAINRKLKWTVVASILMSCLAPLSGLASEQIAMIPQDVLEDGLVIGGEFAYPPQAYYLDGELVGVDIEIATAVANKLGVKPVFLYLPWESMVPSLLSGRIDALWSALYDTQQRQQTFDLVDYYSASWGFLTKVGNPLGLDSITAICGTHASLSAGSASIDLVEEQSAKCVEAGREPVTISTFKDDPAANLAIRSGRTDFNMQDFSTLSFVAEITNDGSVFSAIPITDVPQMLYGVGINKSRADVREMIKLGLEAIIADGEYERILQKWGLEAGAVSEVKVNAGN